MTRSDSPERTRSIAAMYFSPTGTTRRVVIRIAEALSDELGPDTALVDRDFTSPDARNEGPSFHSEDIVVFGVPVYAGRVPKVLLEYIETVNGDGALAIPVVVYGNRDYDDALVELADLLEERGLFVVAAGAFIGEHSFSTTLAQGRPDADDLALATELAVRVSRKLSLGAALQRAVPKGNRPYRELPTPRNDKGDPIVLADARPQTSEACQQCGACVDVCPMGAIDPDDVAKIGTACIRCNACVKACPSAAKDFSHGHYLYVKGWLESHCRERRTPELFL